MRKKSFHFIMFIIIFIVLPAGIPSIKSADIGPFFSVTLLAKSCGGTPCNSWLYQVLYDDLPKIGIAVNDVDITSLSLVLNRTYRYPSLPIPTYSEGGYDLFAWRGGYEFEWLWLDEFHSDNIGYDKGNFYQYNSSLLDFYADALNQTFLAVDRIPIQYEIQQILSRDLPSIPVYHFRPLLIHQNNVSGFDGSLWYADGQTMELWDNSGNSDLHIGDNSIQTLYVHPFTNNGEDNGYWSLQLFNGLLMRENSTHLWKPRLALDYETTNGLNWTFYLDPNAKWNDGNNITADDIIFSYHFMRTADLTYGLYDYDLSLYMDNYSYVKIDNHTVQFNLKKPYIYAEELFSFPIIPKHVWLPSSLGGTGPEIANWKNQAETWFVSMPEKFVGSGPYKLFNYNSTNDVIHLTKNPYFQNLTNFADPIINDVYIHGYDFYKGDAITDFNSGLLDFMAFSNYNINDLSSFINPCYRLWPIGSYVELAVNNKHPYFGTGEACPIASLESAYYVRKAISHTVNRSGIIDTDAVVQGRGVPAGIICPETALGYNTTIIPDEFSIDIAKDYMRLAGFDIPEETGSTPILGISFVISLTFIGLIGSIIAYFMKRMEIKMK